MKTGINMFNGFCMALADSVPGVSGGTIAFILGFYEKLITSLHEIFHGTKEQKKGAAVFLGKLLGGWVVGFCICALILGKLFDSHIYQLSSLFIGLSIFAVFLIVIEERKALKEDYRHLIFTVLGAVIVCLITYLGSISKGGTEFQVQNLNLFTGIYVFLVAMAAISAMVLPGISGSTLLLVFGLYVPVLTGVKELLHFQFSYLPMLIVFGFGVLTGIFTTIRLVRKALSQYRSQLIYLVLGLMIGSIYAIIMGPSTLDVPKRAMNWDTFHPICFLAGGVILFALEIIKRKGNHMEEKPEWIDKDDDWIDKE